MWLLEYVVRPFRLKMGSETSPELLSYKETVDLTPYISDNPNH